MAVTVVEHAGNALDRRRRRKALRAAGLFAGIGGIELGLHSAGHRVDHFCEIDPAATAVLEERFRSHTRSRKVDVRPDVTRGVYPGFGDSVDLVTAGFPCQDLSQAGRTAGIEGAKSGLIDEVLHHLAARPVPWVLLENVPFMLRLDGGRALDVIVSALESLGYRWAYRVIDALAFGVPQRRERVFLLAARGADPRHVLLVDDAGPRARPADYAQVACGFYWTEGTRGLGWAVDAVPTLKGGSTVGIPSPPAVILPGGARVVVPSIEAAEVLQGFEAGWTQPVAERGDLRTSFRWRLVGNAVNVRVAAWLGERLRAPGRYEAVSERPLAKGEAWPRAAYNLGPAATTRVAVDVSTWPVAIPPESLLGVLEQFGSTDLSYKAATGFLRRYEASRLDAREPDKRRYVVEALRAQIARMAPSAGA